MVPSSAFAPHDRSLRPSNKQRLDGRVPLNALDVVPAHNPWQKKGPKREVHVFHILPFQTRIVEECRPVMQRGVGFESFSEVFNFERYKFEKHCRANHEIEDDC